MLEAYGNKFGQIVRNLLPFETSLVFIILSVLVWPIPYVGAISPSLGLIAIFYWSVYRPDLLRPLVVFLLGMLNDAINGLPLGLSAALFLGVHQLAYMHRRFFVGQIFYVLWFGFAVLAFLSMVVSWAVVSVYNGRILTLMPVLLQFAITVVIFPLPAWVLNRMQHVFLTQDRP